MADKSERVVVADIRASVERLEQMLAGLHSTDEVDPEKGELVANLKRKLASLRGGIDQLDRRLADPAPPYPSGRPRGTSGRFGRLPEADRSTAAGGRGHRPIRVQTVKVG